MNRIALYARVSSEQQAQQATIDSQIAALKRRAEADGHVVAAHDVYVDDGFSGATLQRPSLERLRDRVAEGALDIVYVHSPDRLARKYAYQVLLLDELRKHGVTTIFLQGPAGQTAEDELLVQVQGMIAEYERAKILERSRRGKIHRARQGSVNVLGGAPYGFIYVRKSSDSPASYRVVLHEAKVVRRVFDGLVREQKSLGQIARDLNGEKITTPGGAVQWHRSTIRNIVTNPAYIGKAAFGKTEVADSGKPLRPRRGSAGVPRSTKTQRARPPEEWIGINVPSIVSREVFEAAQDQLARNRQLSPRNGRGRHLLQGLTVCARCGYAFYGVTTRRSAAQGGAIYTYYRCMGSDPQRFIGGAICENRPVRAQQIEEHVWKSVAELLLNPRRLLGEWSRRQKTDGTPIELRERRDDAARQLENYNRALPRLVDAYQVGAIDLQELKARSDGVRARLTRAQHDVDEAERALKQQGQLRAVIACVEDFAHRVQHRLDDLSWDERQHVIRMLVAKVEVDENGATVVFRVPGDAPNQEGQTPPSGTTDNETSSESYRLRTGRDDDLPAEGHAKLATRKLSPQQAFGLCGLCAHGAREAVEPNEPSWCE